MTTIDDTIDEYEKAASIRATDFSQLGIDDFANVETDSDGTPYGIVMGVPIKINDKPKEQEGSLSRDVGRGLTRGALGASNALNDALPLLGTPVDLVNKGLREVGDLIGVDLASDRPFLGSDMIRDGVTAVLEFGNKLVPKGANEAFAEYVNEPPNSKILQSIIEEVSKFGVQAVTPAMYLRAFSVMSPFARGIAWGGIADFINSQPDEEGAISAVTKMLSGATPEERGAFANAVMMVVEKQESDSKIISKARAALDGMIIGGALEKIVEGAVLGVKYAKNVNTDDLRERIVQAGARADERLGSVMRGETLSANPIGAVGDMALSAAGRVADRRRVGTTGQYIGAPPGVTSPQKLAALRTRVANLAREGAEGRMWYERSSKEILDAVGGDVDEADKLIQAIAVTSPGTPVKNNFDYALQAYSQWKAGEPIKSGRFPQAMSKKLEEIFNGDQWAGRKTDDFYNNLMIHIDPSRTGPVTGDLWMLRAFGFTKPNEMPSPRQYQFITEETQRIAQEFGWEPHQVQAAIWVTMKGRSENPAVKKATEASSEKKGWIKFEVNPRTGKKERVVIDQANHMKNWLKHAMKHDLTKEDIERAKFDYADALADNRGQISWESIPGRTSNHMPQMFNAPYEQQAEYHVAISKAFLDENGEDIIAKRLGLLSPGDFEAPGFFEGKVSPGSQTVALMPRQYKGAATGDIEKSSQDLVAAYAAVRGILMKQDGVGWHRPFYKAKKSDENGIVLRIGRPFSEAETKRLGDILADLAGHGEYNPIAAEDGVRILNFDFVRRVPDGKGGFKPAMDGTWIDEDKLLTNEEFAKLVNEALSKLELDDDLVVDPVRFHAYTGYSGNDWSVNPNGENYYDAISGQGRSDLQGRVRDLINELQPRIDEIDRDFSERYGWTINDAINATYRGADDVTSPPSVN